MLVVDCWIDDVERIEMGEGGWVGGVHECIYNK